MSTKQQGDTEQHTVSSQHTVNPKKKKKKEKSSSISDQIQQQEQEGSCQKKKKEVIDLTGITGSNSPPALISITKSRREISRQLQIRVWADP